MPERKRPLPVLLIAWLYIAVGALGLIYHLRELRLVAPIEYEIILVSLVRVLAIISGIYMLRGCNWGRWLAMAWMAFHVVLSAFHTLPELAVHVTLCIAFGYFLFRPDSERYFRGSLPVAV